jgi:UbiA prenyltransferase family
VNKPYLPLASGEMSLRTGAAIVAATGAAALALGAAAGSWPLMATLVGSLLLGIAYSVDVPLLRWKRFPVVAASCILAVRCDFGSLGPIQVDHVRAPAAYVDVGFQDAGDGRAALSIHLFLSIYGAYDPPVRLACV